MDPKTPSSTETLNLHRIRETTQLFSTSFAFCEVYLGSLYNKEITKDKIKKKNGIIKKFVFLFHIKNITRIVHYQLQATGRLYMKFGNT